MSRTIIWIVPSPAQRRIHFDIDDAAVEAHDLFLDRRQRLAAQQPLETLADDIVAVGVEHVERGLAENLRRIGGPEQAHRGRIQELDPGIPDDEDAVRRRLHQAPVLISWAGHQKSQSSPASAAMPRRVGN